MDSSRNVCQNHNLSFKYYCREDQELLCHKCIQLQTIHQCHEIRFIKDEKQTHFASKGQSTQQIKLKQKSDQLKIKIKDINKTLKSVNQLYQTLENNKLKIQRQLESVENELESLNKYLLDSRSSHQSFDSFCDRKNNKYNTTANFGVIKVDKINNDTNNSQTQKIKMLIDRICDQLGFTLKSQQKQQKINKSALSPRGLMFSPKSNTNLKMTKPTNLLSPKSPKANMTHTGISPKFANLGYNSFGTKKLKTSPQPSNILDKLRKQKAQFNDFKNKFHY